MRREMLEQYPTFLVRRISVRQYFWACLANQGIVWASMPGRNLPSFRRAPNDLLGEILSRDPASRSVAPSFSGVF